MLDRTVKLRIRTRERRYIVEDAARLEAVLRTQGSPIEYVAGRPETAEDTWSQGLSPVKIRARSYQDPEHWWLELKRRQNERVDKWRRPMRAAAVLDDLAGVKYWKRLRWAVGPAPLRPMFGVRVRRTAFEWLSLRVTLDRDLTFFAVDPASPPALGRRLGRVNGLVVEVKCEDELPGWLAPAVEGCLARNYSKSRYALALLAGSERLYLIAAPAPVPVSSR